MGVIVLPRGKENGPVELLPVLEFEVKKQVDRLIELGFHHVVYKRSPEDLRETRYRRDFMLPANLSKLKAPVDSSFATIVDPRVSLSYQHLKGKVMEFIDAKSIRNLVEIPKKPFLFFPDNPENTRGYGMLDAVKDGQVWCTQVELTSFYIHRGSFFQNLSIFAPASKWGDIHPRITVYYDKAELHVASRGFPPGLSGALSRDPRIITFRK